MSGIAGYEANVFRPATTADSFEREPLLPDAANKLFATEDFAKNLWDDTQASSFVFYRSGVGLATAITNEPMSLVGTNTRVYEITDVLNSYLDEATAVVISDSGGVIDAASYRVDYPRGIVYFDVAPTAPVTLTGEAFVLSIYSPPSTVVQNFLAGRLEYETAQTGRKFQVSGFYFPKSHIGGARSVNFSFDAELLEDTDFASTDENGGFKTYTYGLITGNISIERIDDFSNMFKNALTSRSELLIDVEPDPAASFRGYFLPVDTGGTSSVESLQMENLQFNLNSARDNYVALINL